MASIHACPETDHGIKKQSGRWTAIDARPRHFDRECLTARSPLTHPALCKPTRFHLCLLLHIKQCSRAMYVRLPRGRRRNDAWCLDTAMSAIRTAGHNH